VSSAEAHLLLRWQLVVKGVDPVCKPCLHANPNNVCLVANPVRKRCSAPLFPREISVAHVANPVVLALFSLKAAYVLQIC
jgi:hypothetical protein